MLLLMLFAAAAACGRPRDPEPGSLPSKYGLLTSSRWAYGAAFKKEDLKPVANTNPHPEPKPWRDHPFDLALTPDGKKAYVTLPGSEARPGHEVAVFDVAKRKVVKRITVGSSPWSIAAHPGGRFLVVLNRFSNYASVIDTASDKVTGEIPLDFYCMRLVHNKAGTRAYVSNRYLNQILVLDVDARGGAYRAAVRPLGGFDEAAFHDNLHQVLRRSCGALQCHGRTRGGFYAGDDARKAFFSALENSTAGDPAQSVLLRAALPAADNGFADDRAGNNMHAGGRSVWRKSSPDYRRAAAWIAAARQGPGIPVGNFGSKPYALALSSDERRLFVGNQGTQDISVVDLERGEEVTGIYTQNVITDLALHTSAGHDRLIALSMGIGFGAAKERDPYGGETSDRRQAAAQFTVLRDTSTTEPLPLKDQEVLGPFDAVDGTAASKMGDIQNDITVLDASRLRVPPRSPDGALSYALRANRYEAHADWVRYTSDSAEVLPQDAAGDISPELQRVVGAFPESLVVDGDRVFVVMLGTYELVEYRLSPRAGEPSELLTPVAVYPTGIMPRNVALGPRGTPAEGLALVTNYLGESVSVIDTRRGTSREYAVGGRSRPFPDTNAERGQMFVNTAVFSGDRDTSCMSCHIYDTSDARGWGAGQAIGQMRDGHFVNGGLLGIPQIKNLFAVQPFYFEGTHSAFAGQFDDAREHVPLQAFTAPNPQGDFTALRRPASARAGRAEHEEIQDKTSTASWGRSYLDLEERRDELIRRLTMRYFGKAFDFRDLQRFIGEFQAAETRLMPNPFDQRSPSAARGRLLFNDLAVGCVVCHKPPHFTDKSEPLYHNQSRVLPSLISFSPREGAFTLVGPHYMDGVNGYVRDLEPWEPGGVKRKGMVTTFSLRGLFDRPFVFLHHGRALSVRETFAVPDHYSLRKFKYSPLSGGEEVRPGGKERGFNEQSFLKEKTYMMDTHGATSQLHALQVQDLENFLLSIE
ncbi:MAG: YncE family protein [Elusimicrobia bacterium]|nr:YncE family protein [Elusimicrobiota bacterium]